MVTLEEVLRGQTILAYRSPERAAQLRVAVDAYLDLVKATEESFASRFAYDLDLTRDLRPTRDLFGYAVKVDDRLPLGVWRLADPHGGLLYDPRCGKTLREILAPTP